MFSVSPISKSKLQVQNEELKWKEEKQVLNLQVELLKKQALAAKNDKSTKEDLAKKLKESLAQSKNTQALLEKNIKQHKSTLKKHKKELLEKWHPQLPQALQNLLESEHEALSKDHALIQSFEDIQVYTQSYLELQTKVHLLVETHMIDGKEWQVSCLYIGTAQGYFINKDKSLCGTLHFSNNKWSAKSDLSMLTEIDSAFAQFNRDGRPELVKLKLGDK